MSCLGNYRTRTLKQHSSDEEKIAHWCWPKLCRTVSRTSRRAVLRWDYGWTSSKKGNPWQATKNSDPPVHRGKVGDHLTISKRRRRGADPKSGYRRRLCWSAKLHCKGHSVTVLSASSNHRERERKQANETLTFTRFSLTSKHSISFLFFQFIHSS